MKSLESVANDVSIFLRGKEAPVSLDKHQAAVLLNESLIPGGKPPKPMLSEPVSHAILRSLFTIKESIRKIPDYNNTPDNLHSSLDITRSLVSNITSKIFVTDTPFITLLHKLGDLSQSHNLMPNDLISLNAEELYGILVGLAQFAASDSSKKIASRGEIFFDMFGNSLKTEFAQMEVFDQAQHNQMNALSVLVSR